MEKNKLKIKILLPTLAIIILFILATYIGTKYRDELILLLENNNLYFRGFLIYIGLIILATVIAPLSTLPIIPIASSIWGPFITTFLNIAGWSIGAIIAFYLSRKYGLPLVKHFVNRYTLDKIQSRFPDGKRELISIILLRMIIPVDILSYGLGLFPKIKWQNYLIGTIIGIIPFSFVFAYLGVLPIKYQIIGLLVLGPTLLFIWRKNKLNFTS